MLRTDGLYHWVRHPVYTLSLLSLYLMPWMTWNWLALALGATLYITLALPLEESKLIDEFGEAYVAYRQRVPALLPYRLPK
jgi:protein-S-isoprenylcysteine O-methyltransferase Ste14